MGHRGKFVDYQGLVKSCFEGNLLKLKNTVNTPYVERKLLDMLVQLLKNIDTKRLLNILLPVIQKMTL